MMVLALAIAGLLFFIQSEKISFITLLIHAESVVLCQGLSIIALARIHHRTKTDKPWFVCLYRFLAIVIGSVAGIQLGIFLCGDSWLFSISGVYDLAASIGMAIFFGSIFVAGHAIYNRIIIGPESESRYVQRKLDELKSWKTIAAAVVFNTLVACLLFGLGFENASFYDIVIVSQCIGLSCYFSIYGAFYLLRTLHPLIPSAVGLIIGVFVGPLIGSLIVGKTELVLNKNINAYGRAIIIGLVSGIIASIYFYIRSQLAEAKARIEQEKARKLSAEKDVAETSLKLLQAQIEPHFLFNTLSNVISLLDSDVARGKEMLVELTQYLRTSLVRTRDERTTLGQEIDLVRAYLHIHQRRMGRRLTFAIDLADKLRDILLPPMLLQPLVENAIKHGIEPQLEGGSISVTARAVKDILVLEVADTGQGIVKNRKGLAAGMGVGLHNIRKRLESIFGNSFCFRLEENNPHGIKVIIEIPLLKQEEKNGGASKGYHCR